MKSLLIGIICLISAPPLYAQSAENMKIVCIKNLYADVQSWSEIQQERHDLTNYNASTAKPDEVMADISKLLDGFLNTIDSSQLHNCPKNLAQISREMILYARQLRSALADAIKISRRVRAGREILKRELEITDRKLTRSLANWDRIVPKFDYELNLQYSLINQ